MQDEELDEVFQLDLDNHDSENSDAEKVASEVIGSDE